MFQLNRNDLATLAVIADLRLLSVAQLAVAFGGNREAIGKRLRRLEAHRLVDSRNRGHGRGRGRPMKLFSMSAEGLQLLADKGFCPPALPDADAAPPANAAVDHLLLVNWVLVLLTSLDRRVAFLQTRHLSEGRAAVIGAPALGKGRGRAGRDKASRVRPDAAFMIRHDELQKALLFFLEVDMGTEDLAHPDRRPGDFRHKVRCYQEFFEHGGYKHYEQLWRQAFDGFRLLVVANTTRRLAQLCGLVREMPPSGFVWVATGKGLLKRGLHGDVWSRGGRDDRAPESILGSQKGRIEDAIRGTRRSAQSGTQTRRNAEAD